MRSKTPDNIKDFYENLYAKINFLNPAMEIYDDLRSRNILKLIPPGTKEKILIIGCGKKKDSVFIEGRNYSFGFDIAQRAILDLPKNGKFLVADALSIPFPDNNFTTIIISEVIEHIPNSRQVYLEIERVIDHMGTLIISTPNWISLFGLFRKISELITKVPQTSDNQPYDDWKSKKKLLREFPQTFEITKTIGIWYLPPFHYRGKGISKTITNFIYKMFSPFENFFAKSIPSLGHLILMEIRINKS